MSQIILFYCQIDIKIMVHQTSSLYSQTGKKGYDALNFSEENDDDDEQTRSRALGESEKVLSVYEISAILSTAFSYGCVNSTRESSKVT